MALWPTNQREKDALIAKHEGAVKLERTIAPSATTKET